MEETTQQHHGSSDAAKPVSAAITLSCELSVHDEHIDSSVMNHKTKIPHDHHATSKCIDPPSARLPVTLSVSAGRIQGESSLLHLLQSLAP